MKNSVGTDSRVDVYIAGAPDFARPILRHLRTLMHQSCPNVTETVKWSRPFFEHRGRILCNMSAFKEHCTFGFWPSEMQAAVARESGGKADDAGGQFGRLTRVEDLPDDATMQGYVAEAVRLLESGGKSKRARTATDGTRKPEPPLPDDLARRLKGNPRAAAVFEKFAPGCRREYVEWITEAKRPETREKRLAAAIEMIAEGKQRHWKYQ